MEDTESRYVSVKEAAALLGVSRATLDNYARAGRLKRYQGAAPIRTLYDRMQLETLKRVKPKYQ